jgi:hypothetical protein
MSDFDLTQLETDMSAICSTTYSGEAFVVSGVTYSGVFGQTDQQFGFELVGNRTDATVSLAFNRGAYTPTINALVYRPFDSTTYRITDFKPDLQAYDCTLNKRLA